MSELKPCPFCGNKLIKPCRQQLPELSAPAFWFRCACCGAESGPSKNHPEAITGWNSRAESPELAALREQVKLLREALEDSCETIQSHLSTMPIYTQDGWGVDRFDHEGEYCGFEPVNPDYVTQGLHELAIETTLSIRAALEQIKPKEAE